jgi:HK97 family phage major capsid protein
MSNLSERIEASSVELAEMKDQLVDATKNLEAAPDEEALLVEVEELSGKVEKAAGTIEALKKAESALAARAQNIAPAVAVDLQKHNSYKSEQPGDLLFKHATAAFIAHAEKKDIQEVFEERYKGIPAVKESFDHIRKSQINPAMTSSTGFGAELVQTDVRGFIESLENVSVAAALAGRATSLDFGGFNSVTIPTQNPTAATPTEPSWVAEGMPIPLTNFGFGSTTINRYKLGAISTFTKELAERSTPAIESLIRDGLRKNYAQVLDNALLSAAGAVANVRPAGLLNGVVGIAGVAGGGDASVRGDILALLSAMTAANLGSRPVLLVNNLDRMGASMMVSALSDYMFRNELASGYLMGLEIISSANVPVHSCILVDASQIVTAFDAPSFDVSDVATVVESSANTTAPTMASSAAGAAGTAGQVGPGEGIPVNGDGRALGVADAGFQARSLWQTYSTGIRMIAPASWNVQRAGAVQVATVTTWT